MKAKTEKEKRLFEIFGKFESEKSRDDVLFCAEAMLRAQEALKADYGLAGLDSPLFNGAGAVPAIKTA
jgi:hypothetical protein